MKTKTFYVTRDCLGYPLSSDKEFKTYLDFMIPLRYLPKLKMNQIVKVRIQVVK